MSTNNIRYNYVYLITNKINNKNYVGQHHGFLNDSYMGSGRLILKAIEKYGKKNFSKEILAICNSQKELDILETVYIDLYKSIGKAEYNLSKGGEGGTLAKESKLKISNALKQYYNTNEGKEFKKYLSEINSGKEIPKNIKEILKKKNQDYWNSPEGMEMRKTISKQQKGRVHSQQQIERARLSNTGKKRTAEQNKRNSENIKECWKNPNYRQQLVESHKRLKWWTNGVKDVQAEQCPPGFRRGRSSTVMSKCCPKGRKYYNNGIIEVMRFEQPEGFVPGRLPSVFHKN